MQPKMIGVRELRTNLKGIERNVQKGGYIIVMRHNEPILEIRAPRKTKESLHDAFAHLKFSGGDPNLSKKIDKIVYDL